MRMEEQYFVWTLIVTIVHLKTIMQKATEEQYSSKTKENPPSKTQNS